MRRIMHRLGASAFAALLLVGGRASADRAPGPLRVHPDNPRYFTDDSGKAIYLTGSHIWNDFVDWGTTDPPPRLDYTAFLKWVKEHNHNFIRGWTWHESKWGWPYADDQPAWYLWPPVFARPGPGLANDGKPKFDLTKVSPEYLQRLRRRIIQAGREGIYVSVMLFDGALGEKSAKKPPAEKDPWFCHPFHAANNINGIGGDVNGDGDGWEIAQLPNERGVSQAVLDLEEAYVEAVIDALHDLDNTIYEIMNEGLLDSDNWQNHMIRHIRVYEQQRGYKQHLVWKTAMMERGQNHRTNALLIDSPADVISLNSASMGDYRNNVPAADGRKISILDTDHLWGIGGSAAWVWKAFTRGHHPIFMDPRYANPWGKDRLEYAEIRRAMGQTRGCAERLNLAAMIPQAAHSPTPCSTRYCLFDAGREYLIYQPGSGAFGLLLPVGTYRVEWFNTATGEAGPSATITWRGGRRTFTPPSGEHHVLFVAARKDIGRPRENDGE